LCSEKQERRFLLLQCHVPKNCCSTLFAPVYKRPAKGGLGAFDFLPWAFWAWVFWGFGLILLLWDFWCGKFLEGKKLTEGKRIAKGKRMAKEELIESLHLELLHRP
jgi:hypothetical protein